MYRIAVRTDGKEYALHEPFDAQMQLISPVLTTELGKTFSLTFSIPDTHPNKDKIKSLSSEILVYQNEEEIFCGRTKNPESDFYNTAKIKCEGELAYLLDSVQRPFEFTGSVASLLEQLLKIHNEQTEEKKHFSLGTITVSGEVNAQYSVTSFKNTLSTIKSLLTNRYGGYLCVRKADGKKYLDYIYDRGGINDQVVRFGENLLDFSRRQKTDGVITALIPVGGEKEDGTVTDISSVNGGKDYIYDAGAVEKYGWIWGSQEFDDVTDPAALLAKGRLYLAESIAFPETIEASAVDLGLLDPETVSLKLGYWTNVESIPHHISKRFLLTKKTINLDDPGRDKIVLGQTLPTFTGSTSKEQGKLSDSVEKVKDTTLKEADKMIENATQLITGGKGGYVVIDTTGEDGELEFPWRILIMNTPDKETATNVIQLNQNGIGFSRTGIDGPYSNAWTIDGSLVADFITAGTMSADRIKGGVFEAGGKGLAKDGKIRVLDEQGNEIGLWDKNGLVLKKGAISLGDPNGEYAFSVDEYGRAYAKQMKIDGTVSTSTFGCETMSSNLCKVWRQLQVDGDAHMADIHAGRIDCSELYIPQIGDLTRAINELWNAINNSGPS